MDFRENSWAKQLGSTTQHNKEIVRRLVCDIIRVVWESWGRFALTIESQMVHVPFFSSPDMSRRWIINSSFVLSARKCLGQSLNVKINLIQEREKRNERNANAIFNSREYSFFACNMLKARKLAVGWALVFLEMQADLEPPDAESTFNRQKFMQF